MEPQNRTIRCATCGREFLFTVKEQGFFTSKGFKEPRHCRECRQQRKQAQVQSAEPLTGAPPQQQRFGKGTFKIVCAHCQRETFVPFKPILGKPVLCKDCFIAQKYGAPKPAPEGETPGTNAPPTGSGESKPPTPPTERADSAPDSAVPEPPPAVPQGESPAPSANGAAPQDNPEAPKSAPPSSEKEIYALAAKKPEGQNE